MKHKERQEFAKLGGNALAAKYPNREPQRLGGKRGAVTKLKNDPDYFKKIRRIGIQKQQARKEALNSPTNQLINTLLGQE